MKFVAQKVCKKSEKSLPVRGAWVEINVTSTTFCVSGRSPCGERGLKFRVVYRPGCPRCVAPRAGSVG